MEKLIIFQLEMVNKEARELLKEDIIEHTKFPFPKVN